MAEPLIQAEVVEWLESIGLGHELVTDLPPDSGYAWAIRTTGQAFSVIVAQRAVDRPHLFLQVGISVAEVHRAVLAGLDGLSRELFVLDLRLALLQQPVGFIIEYPDDDRAVPDSITLGFNMIEDKPQMAGFARRHHQMLTAGHVAVTMFKKVALLDRWP
jgi:hypothetical protein